VANIYVIRIIIRQLRAHSNIDVHMRIGLEFFEK